MNVIPKLLDYYLVDRRAQISLILASSGDKSKSPEKLRTVSGSIIHIYEHKCLKLNVGLRRDFLWTFIIDDITTPIISR